MSSRILFIVKYWLTWILFFEVCRLFFLLANFTESKAAGLSNNFGSLLHGFKMDMSVAAYITLPVCLFILLSVLIKFLQRPLLFVVYTGIILFLTILISIADAGLFKAWGYRIDATPLKYLSNPKEAWASISNQPLLWIFFGVIFSWLLIFLFFRSSIRVWLSNFQQPANKVLCGIVLLLLTAALIVPIRGGFQLAPLNQSSVYFSKNNFSNLAAVNATFSFLSSVTHRSKLTDNPFIFMSDKEAHELVSSFSNPLSDSVALQLTAKDMRPNVIIVTWESFTKKATEAVRNGREITPCFNRLKKEGIYFSDIYATGDRTDKGIAAVLSGYPAQAIASIVKIPSKASKLPMLPLYFKANGYRSLFYYGGEPEFANMKAYLSGGKFDQFITIDDFKKKDRNSKWGAHDGPVMEKVFEGLNSSAQPFFCNWLTLTSHEPFETPVATVIEGSDDESLFLNSLHYTDSIVDELVEKCKKQSWWNNTIMIIVADHGHPLPRTGKKIDDFKIPLLFLGGALQQKGIEINTPGSQVDIAATLLESLGYDASRFNFSKNLLKRCATPYAYMAFNNGFGFVQPGKYFFFDNIGRQVIEQAGNIDSMNIRAGKAFEQITFDDYTRK